MVRLISNHRDNIPQGTAGEDSIEGRGSGNRRLGAAAGTTSRGSAHGGDGRLLRSRVAPMLLAVELALAVGAAAPTAAQGVTKRVSLGPGGVQGDRISEKPALSMNGRFVAFTSWATNLVPGDTNDWFDVFVHTR
jgi:hypothetical protein